MNTEPVVPGLGGKRRMLIIVNPYATTVSDRLKNLVVYALQGRYEVEVESTEKQDHATEIGRDAIDGDYDIVVAFGGDGTVNEVANGLAGTDIPVTFLPGGNTNVVCRTLGIPNDVVDATEHLLSLADDFKPRKIDLGKINDRYFVFSCGAGIDATVVEKVDSNPKWKRRAGPWFYSWVATKGYFKSYLRNPVQLQLEVDGQTHTGVTALAQNSDPFTYFSKQPVRVCDNVAIDDGTLGMILLKRANLLDMGMVVPRLLTERMKASGHGQVEAFEHFTKATICSGSQDESGALRKFPVQVDGDYIGTYEEITLEAAPGALTIIA
ncbi:MAG: diacylglycerol kinase family lipid kinase [Solirubrobacterales bacterium]|nr:diacylglycerol kinase family lipid kinase [Solirubrobacterales bacterium]HMT04908.1 diacylglycerol kinase family lipid kinase [Solirubrobacterales bacterium]